MKLCVMVTGLLFNVSTSAQTASPVHHWIDSFDEYKKSIRSLEPAAHEQCVTELRNILEGIDNNASCSNDSECTLLNQDPFGNTVPVRVDAGSALLSRMQHFKASCDNGRLQSNPELPAESTPVCSQTRCLVKLLPVAR
jgi:hypothetical protein